MHARIGLAISMAILAGCGTKEKPAAAKSFLDNAEQKLLTLSVDSSRADWVRSTFITDDTEILAAKADERAIAATVQLAKESARFDRERLDPVLERKLKLLKNALTLAAPSDPKESEEVTRIVSSMEGTYGKGKYCPSGKSKCYDLEDLSKILANSRDANELRDAWT
ncbi:MAG: M2 family metallopeptidase, partial [Acidobacteriota bacterium]|nr:M2 family metallopeptidase [Acidobacteriota bacterium]